MPGLIVLLLAAQLAASAAAATPAEVRLLPGWRDGGTHVAGIEITLSRGWHTYWRVPGASGIPPRFDWSGSTGLAGGAVEWPHPEVFESFGMRTIGYQESVVLPLLLQPLEPEDPIELRLEMSFGVCKDICVPVDAAFVASLSADAEPSAADRRLLEAALARRPHAAAEAGVLDATCRLARQGGSHALSATVRLRAAPGREQVAVIEAAARPDLWIGDAQARTDGATVTAEARVEQAGRPGVLLDRSGLRLTLIDPVRSIEIEGCRAPD